MNYSYNHNDYNYATAINYDGTDYYNCPMTIDIDGKLFILPFGTSDKLYEVEENNRLIIVNENRSLDYIGMVVIDLNDNSIADCSLSGNDIYDSHSPANGIFDMELEDQISVLENYLPY